jgi:hypothetical protein
VRKERLFDLFGELLALTVDALEVGDEILDDLSPRRFTGQDDALRVERLDDRVGDLGGQPRRSLPNQRGDRWRTPRPG